MSANAIAQAATISHLRSRPLKTKKTVPFEPPMASLSSQSSPSSRRKASGLQSTKFAMSSVASIVEPATDHSLAVTQHLSVVAGLNLIKELHRRRQDFLNAEGALTRQIKAIERRMQTIPRQISRRPMSASVPSNGGDVDRGSFENQYRNVNVFSDQNSADGHMTHVGGDSSQRENASQHLGAGVSSDHLGADNLSTDVGRDVGQNIVSTHSRGTGVSSDLSWPDNHGGLIGGDAGHGRIDDHKNHADVSNLVTLQLQIAEDHIRKQRKLVERELVKVAKKLPVYSAFVEPINGFGALGLAQIIGEAGDLAKYSNPAKLWKRFGLGLVGGERQQRHTDPEKAIAHGYSPRRRSVMFVIGDSLLKKQNAYKDLYDARKRYEEQKAIAAGLVVRAAKPGDPVDQVSAGFRSKMVIHRRSQRYVEKRLLRDLWRSWRDHRSRVCR